MHKGKKGTSRQLNQRPSLLPFPPLPAAAPPAAFLVPFIPSSALSTTSPTALSIFFSLTPTAATTVFALDLPAAAAALGLATRLDVFALAIEKDEEDLLMLLLSFVFLLFVPVERFRVGAAADAAGGICSMMRGRELPVEPRVMAIAVCLCFFRVLLSLVILLLWWKEVLLSVLLLLLLLLLLRT